MRKLDFASRRRNILRYLALLAACFSYAYFYGGYFPYTLLHIVLLLPVLSLVHLIIICSFFKLSERLNERIFVKGNYASYHLILQNSSIFYMPYINVRFHMEGRIICKNLKSMRISLAPMSCREYNYEMPLLFRGRYDLGVMSIQIFDILGIFSYTMHSYEKKSILVKPRILDIPYNDVPAARISEGKLSSEYNEVGNDDIANIREYCYGDSLRKIHWKLSSKFGKPLVKDTRNELDNDVVMILNLSSPFVLSERALINEDCMVEELVSQANYLLKNNMPVKLCFFKDDPIIVRVSTPGEFNSLYQLVSEIKFDQSDDFIQTMEYFSEVQQNNNLIYFFTIELNGDIVNKALHIQNNGFNTELFYISLEGVEKNDAEAYRNMADMLMKSNIKSHRLQPSILQAEVSVNEVCKNAAMEVKANET